MPNLLAKTGKIVFLRAHDLGTGFGPPNDALDVEVVFILHAIGDGAHGFQLRNDNKLPARQAMFSLLRDAFVNNLTVTVDFLIDPGKKNSVAIRVALTRNQIGQIPPVVVGQGSGGQVLPTSSASAKSTARSKPKPRKAR